VAADVAALRVREIVRGMVAEEGAWLAREPTQQ
jgi:hypothetical protein